MLRHSHSSYPYARSEYDDQMCLKAPPLLWVAILYLSRAITLPIAMGIGHVAGVDALAITEIRAFWNAYGLIPSLISALILIALFRRVPGAPGWVRRIWARGRLFLVVAASLDIALLLITCLWHERGDGAAILSVAAAAFDAYFLVYILAARRVRHVFAEFPPPSR